MVQRTLLFSEGTTEEFPLVSKLGKGRAGLELEVGGILTASAFPCFSPWPFFPLCVISLP